MWEIEVGLKPEFKDAIGKAVKSDIKEDLGITSVEEVKYIEAYRLEGKFSEKEVERLAKEAFSDAIIQNYSVNASLLNDFDWEISVAYNPDVTDNVGMAAKEATKDLLNREFKEGEDIRSVRKYALKGKLTEEQVKKICSGLLANTLIEKFEYRKGKK